MTDSEAAQVAAYWTQFGRPDLDRAATSALIAERRRALADRVPYADAYSVLPGNQADRLAVIAGRTLYRVRATDGSLSVERRDLSAGRGRIEVTGAGTKADQCGALLRRWRLRLPGDGFEFEVDDPGTALMSATQRFARTFAHRLGRRDVEL
jgi:hypothetical protein